MSVNGSHLHLEFNMLFEFSREFFFLNVKFSILVSVDLVFAVTSGWFHYDARFHNENRTQHPRGTVKLPAKIFKTKRVILNNYKTK